MAYEIQNKQQISTLLASNGVKALGETLHLTNEQIAKANASALQLRSNPALYKCDSFSLIKYCYEIAIHDFSRSDCAYPVPYGDKVQCQISYRGFKEKALMSGNYSRIDATKVFENDKVVRDRDTGALKVIFDENYNENAKCKGYYAYAMDKNGIICDSVYWSVEKCEAHGRKYSKAYDSIWGDKMCFEKMCLKTVMKQLCNNLSFSSPELQALAKQDQIVYGKENEKDGYLDNPHNKDNANSVSNKIEAVVSEEDKKITTTPEGEIVESKVADL